MDAALWSRLVPVIEQTLSTARPDCAPGIAERADTLQAELDALDDWARSSLASIPEKARVLVTAHDAFGYFARAYGVRQEAIQGFSTESEASVADLQAIAAVVIETGVPAVFVESTINPRTIEAMREAVAAGGGTVALGGSLFSDAMGEAGTPEGTYIGMMRANVQTIATALGGTPSPWPEALRPWAERNNVSP
jgi:manganese/zinc/iron transport system substrate-binding protein